MLQALESTISRVKHDNYSRKNMQMHVFIY
jgi:hypothetical protein